MMTTKIATNRPDRMPTGAVFVDPIKIKEFIKAKFVPRPPKDGEQMMMVRRPQSGPYTFTTYAVGDLICVPSGNHYVVTARKDGYVRSGEGWKEWNQLLVVRTATEQDHAAVAAEKLAHEAEAAKTLNAMMNR